MRIYSDLMWTCTDIRQRSAAYFANQLPTQESQRLEQHLAGCSKCRLALSEAYSGYRLASAAFHAPDAVGGLSATRLGTIYAAASGAPTTTPTGRRSELRQAWFAAAACAVVVVAAWMGRPISEPALDAPLVALAMDVQASPAASEVVTASGAMEVPKLGSLAPAYPASYGLIYPADYRAAGGYTPDDLYATVMIDLDSITDPSIFIYEPAYGFGRTVVWNWARTEPVALPVEYGLGGPGATVRL